MPLAPYADFWQKSKSGERSLKDFIPCYLQDNYLGAYKNFVQQQLEAGHVFLLFDGLDEIPDDTLRIEIVRQIEAFTRTYAMNFFIVTSRIVGYNKAQLAADYQAFTLDDFDQDQIKLFAQKWCPTYERWVKGTTDNQLLQAAATREADKLFNATQRNPGVKKLAVNPLLLTILALIQRQGTDLPSHRVKLFNLCADTLINTWVKATGRTSHFSETELVKILRPLAFWMHEHPAIGAIPEDELTEQVAKQLLQRKLARDEVEATKRAELFLATVRGQTGILVERGKQRYGFLHQNFEEYFAARELALRKDRNDFIKQHLHHARWREVILLAVGIIGVLDSNEEGVTELVEEAILKAGSPFEKWLHRDLLFAGLCLADDVGVSVTCENEIIEQIMDLYLTSPFDSLLYTLDQVLLAWKGTRVARKAVQLILPLLSSEEVILDATMSFELPSDFSKFAGAIIAYYRRFAQIDVLRIRAMRILSFLQVDVSAWIGFILVVLADQKNSNWKVRDTAVRVLGQVGKGQLQVVIALLKVLSSFSNLVTHDVASRAIGLVSVGHPNLIKRLLEVLYDADSNDFIRRGLTRALGEVGKGQPKIVKILLEKLTDPDELVQVAAAEALEQVSEGQTRIINALLSVVSDANSDRNVRMAITRALGKVGKGQQKVINTLSGMIFDVDFIVRDDVANALGQVARGQPKLLKTLQEMLSNSNSTPVAREMAAKVLGKVSNGEAVTLDILIKSLLDANLVVQQEVARALGQVGKGQAKVVVALLEALSKTSLNTKEQIVNALGQVGKGQPKVVKVLLNLLFEEENRDVKVAAVEALGRIGEGQTEVVESLLTVLSVSDQDLLVEWKAVESLGQVGDGQPSAIRALQLYLSDKFRFIQYAAASALATMQIDRQIVGQYIEDLLQKEEPIASKQIEADENVDALLFSLRQIVGGI